MSMVLPPPAGLSEAGEIGGDNAIWHSKAVGGDGLTSHRDEAAFGHDELTMMKTERTELDDRASPHRLCRNPYRKEKCPQFEKR